MRLSINGEPAEVPDALSVGGLIRHLGLAERRLAIELNRQIIRKDGWEGTLLNEADVIEIVNFVGGG